MITHIGGIGQRDDLLWLLSRRCFCDKNVILTLCLHDHTRFHG